MTSVPGSVPSASTWGSPAATKHALLIHGLTSSSHTWHRVASSLAAQGYMVTAPNLIGHSSRVSPDYHLSSIVEDLRPYVASRNYDLIIGHSLGAITTLGLFKHLSQSHPTAFVLVDPPLQLPREQVDFFEKIFIDNAERVEGPEVYATKNPLWSREDCISRELATRLCPVETIRGVLSQNDPWSFIDNFNAISTYWKVTVLIADLIPVPILGDMRTVDTIKPFPQLRGVVVPGASHWIQSEFPEVVVKEALNTVTALNTFDTLV